MSSETLSPRFGSVLVGLFMRSADEAEIMLRALDERLRNIGPTDPDRKKLESWRLEAMNITHRAAKEEWAGWEKEPHP